MDLSLTTPALLFPAISLVMLAYTNRFMALSAVVRSLHEKYKQDRENALIHGQISNLRYRLVLVRRMQFLGVISFLFAIISMCLIFLGFQLPAKLTFVASIMLFGISLLLSLMEIIRSTKALELELSDMEGKEKMPMSTLFKRPQG